MSSLAIVLVAAGVVVLLLLAAGYAAVRRRGAANEAEFARHVAEADQDLEHARAADKGWDRELIEGAARLALAEQRPGWGYDSLHLVLVDDRPGVAEDRAHVVARGRGRHARVVVARGPAGWAVERVDDEEIG
jgi:hypothetical protein